MTRDPDNGFVFKPPSNPTEFIEQVEQRGRIAVPSRNGTILDLLVRSIEHPSIIDGDCVDAVVEAQATVNNPIKKFCLILSGPARKTSLPTLWFETIDSSGEWLLSTRPY